jgi:hypothetical protein
MKEHKRRVFEIDEELPEGMAHADFSIGCEFTCGGKRWRCTDVGTRVIVAICLEPREMVRTWRGEDGELRQERYMSEDPRDLNGPPYGVTEQVFDENDLGGCTPFATAKAERGS